MENKIPLRFFIIAFSWTWLVDIFIALLTKFEILSSDGDFISMVIKFPFVALSACGPAIGACISLRSINGKGSVKEYLKSFLSLNFGWKAWTAIFGVLGISAFIAWITPEFFGEDKVPALLPTLSLFPLYFFLMVFFGGGQEEIGWRGYILPFFEKKYGLIIGSLVLGIIWSAWHLPTWIIPGSGQSNMNFISFTLQCIGCSYLFSWIRSASGERLFSGLVVHGAANSFIVLFPVIALNTDTIQIRYWIYSILIFVIGIIIVTIRTIKSRKTST